MGFTRGAVLNFEIVITILSHTKISSNSSNEYEGKNQKNISSSFN